MRYQVRTGVLVPFVQKYYKLLILAIAGLFTLSYMVMTLTASAAPKNSGSNGKVTFDTTVYADSENEMNYGDGIPNGEWVVAEVQGVKLGARATDRKDGLLNVVGTNGNRVGIYEASTGYDGSEVNRAEWNYEWSVDLSNAKGNATGKTLADYNLTLEQDYTNQFLFNLLGSDPVELPFGQAPFEGTCDYFTALICQQSYNPTFGNTDFEMNEEGTYNLRFVLTPKTFNGPPVAVAIQVNVLDNN